MQIVAVNVLGTLSVTAEGNKYVLVVLTSWVEAYAIRNQEALTVPKCW